MSTSDEEDNDSEPEEPNESAEGEDKSKKAPVKQNKDVIRALIEKDDDLL